MIRIALDELKNTPRMRERENHIKKKKDEIELQES
jgi:hypothetical protein